jgi:hypothetical protein
LATPAADSNLSLGKLAKATGVNSDYSTQTLMSDCAGNTTADQNHSVGSFYISGVDSSLTGYAFVDESTNETYEITFANANSLFTSRIATRAGNFTWTTSNSSLFDMSGTEDATTQYNAGAIADSTSPGSLESTLVTDGTFDNWTGTTALDDWTESGTIAKNTSGQSGNAVTFTTDNAYVEQSFTVKGNSTYQISASVYTTSAGTSNLNAYISGAYHQTSGTRWTGMAQGSSHWSGFREDFYTSGSAGATQTLKVRFTAPSAGTTNVHLDTVSFQRWEGAHFSDTSVTITGKYNDSSGDNAGFNDHADNYNTVISKAVEIQDTYAGLAIACFLPGTMIKMADGTEKDIEDITVGDEVLSSTIPNLPDEDLGYNEWKTFTSTDDMSNLEVSSAIVEKMFYDYMEGYWNIKGYDLKDYDEFLINVTKEHDFWAYRDDIWSWRKPTELKVGDHLLDFSGNLVKIDFLNYVDNEVEVINFDVEPLDIYYAGGLLVHNKGAGSDPGS